MNLKYNIFKPIIKQLKMKKSLLSILFISLLAVVGCKPKDEPGKDDPNNETKLAAPVLRTESVTANGFTIVWEAVENATGYVASLEGEEQNLTETKVSYSDLAKGEYMVQVKAVSSDENYKDSDWTGITVTVEGEVVPNNISIEVISVGEKDAQVQFVPNNGGFPYYARIMDKATLVAAKYRIEMMENGKRTDESDAFIQWLVMFPHKEYVQDGSSVTISEENLLSNADYVAVAFEYDTTEGAEIPAIFFKEFKTKEASTTVSHFTFSNKQIDFTTATVKVTPDDNNKYWCHYLMRTEDFVKYSQNGDHPIVHAYYGFNNLGAEEALYEEYGNNFIGFIRKYALKGEQTIDAARFANYDIAPETEYTLLVMYVDYDNGDVTNVYDWDFSSWEFKTLKPDEDAPVITISDPIIENGVVTFDVKTSQSTETLSYVFSLKSTEHDKYFTEENGWWKGVRNFYMLFYKHYIEGEDLEAAKTDGISLSMNIADLEEAAEGSDITEAVLILEATNSQGVVSNNGVLFSFK